ncbi:MAG: electron transport complex subunit E [Candidatus Marinimicrobia bacterium]|nr:electron transport complex subunit E [bacterium]MCG2716478.1 electron transport complex subunit E [Candidatus Neomarinimicrobiota bacterium]
MAKKITLSREFLKGLWDENPVLRMLLGLCPALAVTNSGINGLSMGLAVIFTLVMSSAIISLARNIIPNEVRIPTFIIVIATFVTIADKMLAAYFPDISKALGPFVPLIVVNCIILGRQEAFSSKNSVGRAVIDAFGMSIGFTITLTILGSFRELFGVGTIFAVQIMPDSFEPLMVMVLQPGAFLTLGLMIGIGNWLNARRAK